MDNNEIKIDDYQIFLSAISIITVIISITLVYNDKLKLEKKDTLFTNKEVYNISLVNRIVILILLLCFLFINYQIYLNVKKKGKEDPTSYLLQIISSILIVIAAIITTYATYISTPNEESAVENPFI